MIIVLVVLSRVYFIIYFINVVLRKGKPMPHGDVLPHLRLAA